MRIRTLLQNRNTIRIISIGILLALTYATARMFPTERENLLNFVIKLFHPYFFVAEYLANNIIHLWISGVDIKNHSIVFSNFHTYFNENVAFLGNWARTFLYFKETALLVLCFWGFQSTLKKKIQFSLLLIVVHLFAVVSGLVMLAGIGPVVENLRIAPEAVGSLALYTLFGIWVKQSKLEIDLMLKRVAPNFILTNLKINEILSVLFILILLNNFIVPFFEFNLYTNFYLHATKSLSHVIGLSSQIDGDYLIGSAGGTLFIAKWCLGINSLFIFAAMVFLTRKSTKTFLIFSILGIIFLHILNIIRLTLLLIFVQKHNDNELIMEHHDLYNIVVYLVIFILWILWFEKFSSLRNKAKLNKQSV